mmetsp:Transcript_15471/g.22051  ORF Transcript_15471/g.22051 Transcript_15471/m.22051 type:complete len:245 (+) Transcript_15471:86-820(+)
METTQAWMCTAPGAPLELKTITLPPLKETQVQVDIEMCGLCHTDIHMQDNDWGISNYPMVPGHEGVGFVSVVGSAVHHLKVGDRVGIAWMRDSCNDCGNCKVGRENICLKGYQGTFLSSSAGCWGTEKFSELGCFSKVVRVEEKFAFKVRRLQLHKAKRRVAIALPPSPHDTRSGSRRGFLSKMYSRSKLNPVATADKAFIRSFQKSKLAKAFMSAKHENEQLLWLSDSNTRRVVQLNCGIQHP